MGARRKDGPGKRVARRTRRGAAVTRPDVAAALSVAGAWRDWMDPEAFKHERRELQIHDRPDRPRKLTRQDQLDIVERTAGVFRDYAKIPPTTPREEREAFEQGVADEVIASLEREARGANE